MQLVRECRHGRQLLIQGYENHDPVRKPDREKGDRGLAPAAVDGEAGAHEARDDAQKAGRVSDLRWVKSGVTF